MRLIHNEDGKLVKRPAKRSNGSQAGVGRNSGIDGKNIMSIDWKRRFKLFIQRFWQPTSACMTCMPGSWGNVMSLAHWTIAFHTGLLTGLLAVLLTFTPAAKLYANRYGNALVVGLPDNIGRRLLARESLPHPLCRAHRHGCYFRSLDAGCLISL